MDNEDFTGIGPAFAIFAGGGARSIAHVGALKAAHALGAIFRGYAGTSGGAVVAALAAVGYTADEIFNPTDPQKSAFAFLNGNPVSSLFDNDWNDLIRTWSTLQSISEIGFFRCLHRLASLATAYRNLSSRQGILRTQRLRFHLNRLLLEKLIANGALDSSSLDKDGNYTVRFRDVNNLKRKCVDLKIVASCVNSYEPWVFSSHGTPDIAISDAVTASAAIPFAFEPVIIDIASNGSIKPTPRMFVDGGLASNLPIWLFRDERLREERILSDKYPHSRPVVHLLAFSLRPDKDDSQTKTENLQRMSPLSFFLRIARLTLQSSQSIIEDFVEGLTVVDLPSGDLDVLDFDRKWHVYKTAYVDAFGVAKEQLRSRLRWKAPAINSVFSKFAEKTSVMLQEASGVSNVRFRYCAIIPVRYHHDKRDSPLNFRVAHAFGFGDDADDQLLLDKGNAGPVAFLERQPVVFARGAGIGPGVRGDDSVRMTRYEKALVWQDLKSLIAWPVFADHKDEWSKGRPEDRKEPLGVLGIDCDADLSSTFLQKHVSKWLVENSSGFGEVFQWILLGQERD